MGVQRDGAHDLLPSEKLATPTPDGQPEAGWGEPWGNLIVFGDFGRDAEPTLIGVSCM